ncbi:DUF7715 family protein [Amycolatopsis magusensis]|uniref:DUF7715 family protein n=1 Tax=Amycolatopsis magusensis TaxID=882444 RepID=UPI0037A3F0EA
MRLLVATHCTQGARTSDFDHVFAPEPVQLAPVCDRDVDDPDGTCGCRRAFIGIRSRRPVTTAVVTERAMSPEQLRSLLHFGYRTSGYPRAYDDEQIHHLAHETAVELEELAARFPPGTVLERRDQDIVPRDCPPAAAQPHEEPTPVPGEPCGDNGFVSIGVYGDDRDEVFPAWVPEARWNGFAIPAFSRDAAARVVDWTNRLYAECPDGVAFARWDGEVIELFEPEWEEYGPSRIAPDQHGRYHIGDGWMWDDQRCWLCHVPARPDETGAPLQRHHHGCPTSLPADQWPLAAHDLL